MSRKPPALTIEEVRLISSIYAYSKVLKDLVRGGVLESDPRLLDLTRDIMSLNRQLAKISREIEERHKLDILTEPKD